MSSTNISVISGYVPKDAELTFSKAGFAFLNFSIPVKSQQKVGERYEDRTDWIDVKVLGKSAERLAKILLKGVFVVVTGKLQQETWEKDGQKRSKVVLLADNIALGPRQDGGGGARQQSGGDAGGYDGGGAGDFGDIPFAPVGDIG